MPSYPAQEFHDALVSRSFLLGANLSILKLLGLQDLLRLHTTTGNAGRLLPNTVSN
jgi:hypothetical protein